MALAKLEQRVGRAVGAEREYAVAARMARDHVEGAGADRAGGAEDREVHAAPLSHGTRSAATGRTAVENYRTTLSFTMSCLMRLSI